MLARHRASLSPSGSWPAAWRRPSSSRRLQPGIDWPGALSAGHIPVLDADEDGLVHPRPSFADRLTDDGPNILLVLGDKGLVAFDTGGRGWDFRAVGIEPLVKALGEQRPPLLGVGPCLALPATHFPLGELLGDPGVLPVNDGPESCPDGASLVSCSYLATQGLVFLEARRCLGNPAPVFPLPTQLERRHVNLIFRSPHRLQQVIFDGLG